MTRQPAVPSVGYRWRPVDDLPEGWQELVDADLAHLVEYWNEHREELASHGGVQDFNRRLQREWVIETGLIEGIYTLDRGTTQILIERGLHENLISESATNRDPALVSDILRDHATSLDALFDFVRRERELSTSFVKELHAELLAHQDTATARNTFGRRVEMPLTKGEYKKRPNSPIRADGLLHEYCPPEQVALQMERLVEMHVGHVLQGIPPEVEAAWLHHRFVQIHPFQDGNGRVARALATLVMIREGLLTLVVTDAMRGDYIGALEAADNGDLGPLVRLFADIQRRAIYGAIAMARNIIAEKRHLKAVVRSVADRIGRRRRQLASEWDKAKDIGITLGRAAERHLRRAEAELETVLSPALDAKADFWVAFSADDPARRSYYRYQVVETAKVLEYFANTDVFHSWAALNLQTDSRHELFVSIHGMGRDFGGLLVGSACLATRERTSDGDGTVVTKVQPVVDRPFQISYKEAVADVRQRFERWLGNAVVQGLVEWQETL